MRSLVATASYPVPRTLSRRRRSQRSVLAAHRSEPSGRSASLDGLTRNPRPLYSADFAGPLPLVSVPKAPVAELVDALDSKSSSARSAGSIPARGTNQPSAIRARHNVNRDAGFSELQAAFLVPIFSSAVPRTHNSCGTPAIAHLLLSDLR